MNLPVHCRFASMRCCGADLPNGVMKSMKRGLSITIYEMKRGLSITIYDKPLPTLDRQGLIVQRFISSG